MDRPLVGGSNRHLSESLGKPVVVDKDLSIVYLDMWCAMFGEQARRDLVPLECLVH